MKGDWTKNQEYSWKSSEGLADILMKGQTETVTLKWTVCQGSNSWWSIEVYHLLSIDKYKRHLLSIDKYKRHLLSIDKYKRHLLSIDKYKSHLLSIDKYKRHLLSIDKYKRHLLSIDKYKSHLLSIDKYKRHSRAIHNIAVFVSSNTALSGFVLVYLSLSLFHDIAVFVSSNTALSGSTLCCICIQSLNKTASIEILHFTSYIEI